MNTKYFIDVLSSNPDLAIHIMLPNGEFVPNNFHITEVGFVHKQFIDCGGTSRDTFHATLQVWAANDLDHRLNSTKLLKIVKLQSLADIPMMVEYGSDTISQYPLGDVEVTPQGLLFILGCKPTACLAPDKCGVKGCC